MIEAVLFDLDGTLADTAADLANALNRLRKLHNMQAISPEILRSNISLGSNTMIKLGFNLEESEAGFEELRQQFLDYYLQDIAKETRLFEGMEETLEKIEKEDIPWGIVTNKTNWLTRPLLEKLGLTERIACLVCGDTLEHCKPHPAPILHACRIIDILPSSTVYIGDAKRDVEAGRQAGTKTLIALYGYIDKHEDIDAWQANDVVSCPTEINDKLSELCGS